eukprot:CAMPEP_0118910764 /NCGR_PEP_ID=MMETSP1166-20130328/12762_1 /TAXON_ID=1104430 /ORGANISM="Chrysoreinhardia sp, Strain CCMP3193" /LENGTH=457 /DNA_ID=CAMNT_0006850237 /DNA_START=42 /DNA_END=1415 /DNA_ORIENTATION=-
MGDFGAEEALSALGPLDGRYRDRVGVLRAYFSESALMKYRVRVEVEYLIALAKTLEVNEDLTVLREVYAGFDVSSATRIKAIEKVTNHDVKAVEYFLKEQDVVPETLKEMIHFGLTSQDVNHVAQPLALAECAREVLVPKFEELVAKLKSKAVEWKDVGMLARTHGQAATPTRLGKEFAVFADRLGKCVRQVKTADHSAKFGGATGGMNAHYVAYPKIDWFAFGDRFVRDVSSGLLTRQQYTTQIEQYDDLAAFCHALTRMNTVLLDLCRDAWQYVSLGYFRQIVKANEVGSSAMPHKVNPIDFENAEGNLGVANALFAHLAAKLPVSRLQRDLSDSTVLRTIGMPLGHTYLAVLSIMRGLSKIAVDLDAIHRDLEQNWAVVAEAIQTILRRERYPEPYEALKKLTRGKTLTQLDFHTFIDSELPGISDDLKNELKAVSPHTYLGAFHTKPLLEDTD